MNPTERFEPMEQRSRLVGVGIYTRADAARLLRMTPSRVSRWIKGYTYWLKYRARPVRREQPAVVETDLPQVGDVFALSFLELIELRIVKAFVDRGVPLQRVRVAAEIACREFDTRHPFATRRVFVAGGNVFTELGGEDVLELTPLRHLQIQSGELVRPFLEEIEFEEKTTMAHRWWPLGRSKPIVLDPAVAFGAPVIESTATRTDVIASLASITSVSEAAQAFRLATTAAEAAAEFELFLAHAA